MPKHMQVMNELKAMGDPQLHPESAWYLRMRDIFADEDVTLPDALEAAGLTEGSAAVRYEWAWVFAKMEATPGLMDQVMASLRNAFANRLPIRLLWHEQPAGCSVTASVGAGELFLGLETPMLDLDKLAPGMFASGMSGSIGRLTPA